MEDGVATLDQKEYDIHESIRRVLIGRMNDIDRMNSYTSIWISLRSPAMLLADQARIEQVIFNITDNAIKFLQ